MLALAFTVSARPGALVIRALLATPPTRRSKTAPIDGVAGWRDEHYDDADPDARFDVYFPANVGPHERLPTVVWVHGGAYIGGRKDDAAPYFERLASAGFTVVSVEYARAPRARYPVAVGQVNRAIAVLVARNERYHVDVSRLVLAGDSAGAQIASQIATVTTNPEYASEIGIVPSLALDQLRGTVLFGGVYDGNAVVRHDGAFTNAALQLFIASVLWAYTGERGRTSTAMREMSTINHATDAFPPTFISGGNADPFTSVHSKPFAARLAALGVDVSTGFFADDHAPALPHQFQFDVDTDDGASSLDAVVAFVKQRTA